MYPTFYLVACKTLKIEVKYYNYDVKQVALKIFKYLLDSSPVFFGFVSGCHKLKMSTELPSTASANNRKLVILLTRCNVIIYAR